MPGTAILKWYSFFSLSTPASIGGTAKISFAGWSSVDVELFRTRLKRRSKLCLRSKSSLNRCSLFVRIAIDFLLLNSFPVPTKDSDVAMQSDVTLGLYHEEVPLAVHSYA